MKSLQIALLFLFIIVRYASAQSVISAVPDSMAPVMTFTEMTFDFGTVVQGTLVVHEFKFKNTGRSPLIINGGWGCGPAFPEYPVEPIKPDGEGVIRMIFGTDGKMGYQDKTSTIAYNTDEIVVLHLTGNVIILPPADLPSSGVPLNTDYSTSTNNSAVEPVKRKGPILEFQNKLWNIEGMKQGEIAEHDYTFTNTGDEPLIISGAVPNCSCLVATFSSDPVKPGKTGVIHVTFNSSGLSGYMNKLECITSNTSDGIAVTLAVAGNLSAPAVVDSIHTIQNNSIVAVQPDTIQRVIQPAVTTTTLNVTTPKYVFDPHTMPRKIRKYFKGNYDHPYELDTAMYMIGIYNHKGNRQVNVIDKQYGSMVWIGGGYKGKWIGWDKKLIRSQKLKYLTPCDHCGDWGDGTLMYHLRIKEYLNGKCIKKYMEEVSNARLK